MPPGIPGFRQVYKGRDEFLDFMSTWTEDFEDFSIELERLIDAGDDRVVGLFHQRGIGKGSGAPVELHTALVHELQDGQVVRMRNYLDPKGSPRSRRAFGVGDVAGERGGRAAAR